MTVTDSENLILQTRGQGPVGYAVYGDPEGAALLALHGAPACRLMFSVAHEAAYERGLRIIAPDRPGYGLTPPDRNATLAARTQWLAEFADAARLGRFCVLGISGGAPYAVALAALMPDRVSGLALVSPMGPVADYQAATAARKGAAIGFVHRRFFLHIGQHLWLTRPVGAALGSLVRAAPETFSGIGARLSGGADATLLARPGMRRYFAKFMREAFRQGAYGGTSDLAIYGRPWDVDARAANMPAIVWQGTADRIVPERAAEFLAQQLPQCAYLAIRGGGHFWVLEHMAEVMNSIGALPS